VFQDKKYQRLIKQIKAAVPSVLAIYAFGSQITGHANEHSDLDLAILVDGPIETLMYCHTKTRQQHIQVKSVLILQRSANQSVLMTT